VEKETSIDKALELCEVLSGHPRGLSLSELARAVRQPPSTVHRLLARLKRRGYVRQDDETQRYGLTLKMLDLSFRALGRSELRLHAYPIMRTYVLKTGHRGFIAIPATGEVTYLWSTGPDEVAMHTSYGKEMPGHCALYFSPRQATRRLSCLRLVTRQDVDEAEKAVVRLGPPPVAPDAVQRLFCTCAPVMD
jgi:DNA-binding IclR family transcriptional regulator